MGETSLVDRKWAELSAKAGSLGAEIDHWRHLTTDDKQPFTKHHSQVLRISGRLEGLLAAVRKELSSRDTLLGRANQVQANLLKAHAIWEFFRGKLMLRADSYLAGYLTICDELAWDCYEPAQARFVKSLPEDASLDVRMKVKEPPFVFLNGVWSPYAVGRERSFSVELATGGWTMPGVEMRVADKLPVPVIGLPWYQVSHLPDVLVIEHEVGHIVEWDFGLTATTKSAIERAAPKQKEAWFSWRSEVFADIYGCLAGGASFVRSLIDFLASEVAMIQGEKKIPGVWGQYPPTWQRVRIVLEALSCHFPIEAAEIQQTWEIAYGVSPDKDQWEADTKAVVASLLQGPYPTLGGCRLDEVLRFPAEEGIGLDITVAGEIRKGIALTDTSPRVLLSVGRRLYDDSPEAFFEQRLGERLRDLIISHIPKGTRGTTATDLAALVEAETKWSEQQDGDLLG